MGTAKVAQSVESALDMGMAVAAGLLDRNLVGINMRTLAKETGVVFQVPRLAASAVVELCKMCKHLW